MVDAWALYLSTKVWGHNRKETRNICDKKPFFFSSSAWVGRFPNFLAKKCILRNLSLHPLIHTPYCVCLMNSQEYVSRISAGTVYAEAATCFVDNKMPDALRFANWMFPVKTTGSNSPITNEGNHWSLIHYDVKANMWTFYDSLSSSFEEDVHLRAAAKLVSISLLYTS